MKPSLTARLVKGVALVSIGLAAVSTGRAETTICVDPGHPSEVNSGRTVQNGTSEFHIDWLVSQRLRDLLQQQGLRVVMTKEREGQLVRNKDRALIANEVHAALLIRLHCDTGAGSGYAIYFADRPGTKDGVSGPSPELMVRSHEAARAIHDGMAPLLKGILHDGGVLGESRTYVGSRQGALTGSIFSRVPAVTVEMVVLANRHDAAFIKSDRGQDSMARALAAGVWRFLQTLDVRQADR